ncbi:MAG TPA: hypothetical protein V6D16_23785 [Candidatus Obscuribacterales bacterium]
MLPSMGAITIGKTESVEASDIVDRQVELIFDRDNFTFRKYKRLTVPSQSRRLALT